MQQDIVGGRLGSEVRSTRRPRPFAVEKGVSSSLRHEDHFRDLNPRESVEEHHISVNLSLRSDILYLILRELASLLDTVFIHKHSNVYLARTVRCTRGPPVITCSTMSWRLPS